MVDDDLLVLATTSLGLQQVGYTVLQADSGLLALQICKDEKPDLVLLDIRMPGISGLEVAKFLHQDKTPFVFLSAYGDEDIVKTAVEAGALGYLVKPMEIERIIPAIEVALVRADELYRAVQLIDNLSSVLDRNREIDIAVGMLMERYRLNRVKAFEKLRNHARANRKKIKDVAVAVMEGMEFFL